MSKPKIPFVSAILLIISGMVTVCPFENAPTLPYDILYAFPLGTFYNSFAAFVGKIAIVTSNAIVKRIDMNFFIFGPLSDLYICN